MLTIGLDVEFEGERAEVIAESADGRRVWIESPSHPYPGVEVKSDCPLRVLACPVCGHWEPSEPPLPQRRAEAIEQAIRDTPGAHAEFHAPFNAAQLARSRPSRRPGGG